jgi:hypothetical protein
MQKEKPEVGIFPRVHQDAVIPVKAGIRFFNAIILEIDEFPLSRK